jgi:hypothetical protein
VHSSLASAGNVATMFTRQYILRGFAIDSDLLRAHGEMAADDLYEIARQPSRSSRIERSLRVRHYFYILSLVSTQLDEILSTSLAFQSENITEAVRNIYDYYNF